MDRAISEYEKLSSEWKALVRSLHYYPLECLCTSAMWLRHLYLLSNFALTAHDMQEVIQPLLAFIVSLMRTPTPPPYTSTEGGTMPSTTNGIFSSSSSGMVMGSSPTIVSLLREFNLTKREN